MVTSRAKNARSRQVFRAIADPVRRGILDRLKSGNEIAALDLGERLATRQPSLSKHLKVLREAGLVHARREGRMQYYSIRPEPLREVVEWIEAYRQFWEDRLDALKRHLEGS